MHLHEYQAKAYLREFGIPVPECLAVSSAAEAEKWGKDRAVVKVQIHAGGRGKAGGVKICRSKEEILQAVKELLGKKVVTQQTGPEGLVSSKVLIDSMVEIEKEYYLSAVIDRASGKGMLVGSAEGGMDIESVPADKIVRVPIELDGKIRGYNLVAFAKGMGWKIGDESTQLIKNLAKAFVASDASLIEINPLIRTPQGNFWAIDTKMTIDDNALFRQKKLAEFFDPMQQPQNEVKAREFDLAYVSMDGNIGCMVNGAGLAMATMDIIHYYGGKPANFLDVGGSATEERVAEGFRIILSDPKVKAILVNIFGGIMNCKTIAAGVMAAARGEEIKVPLVVRLEGTNVEEGKKMLAESGLNIIVADSLSEAAEKVVKGG